MIERRRSHERGATYLTQADRELRDRLLKMRAETGADLGQAVKLALEQLDELADRMRTSDVDAA